MTSGKVRQVGQVSFSMRSGYEKRLYEHAHKPEHGDFSNYVKRLIDRDMSGVANTFMRTQTEPFADEIDVTAFL